MQVIRELLGVMTAEKMPVGICVTTSTFTPEARAFAENQEIRLLERRDVLEFVSNLQADGENLLQTSAWVCQFAASSRVKAPKCPRCSGEMRLRNSRKRPSFWGCAQFPRCWGKREARHELLPFGS